MKVLVCGGRDFGDAGVVFRKLGEVGATMVMHGACATGADVYADRWALEHGVYCVRFPADWERHGRSAGPRRNQRMLEEGRPDLVLAFEGGRGTADMVNRAKRAGVPVIEVK